MSARPSIFDTPTVDLGYHSLLINEFYLTPCMVDTLSHHYVLHWEGSHLQSVLEPGGVLTRDGISYILILPSQLRSQYFKHPLKLSFRKPKWGNNLAYVLVRYA